MTQKPMQADFYKRILSLLPAPPPGYNVWQNYWAQGEQLNGQLHGDGMEYDPKNPNPFYEGEFRMGKRHGKGKECEYLGSIVYEGEFKDGKRHGEGTEHGFGFIRYVGGYQNGKCHGTGKWYGPGNNASMPFHEGHFEDGKRCGEGTRYAVDDSGEGVVWKGIWFKEGFMYGRKYDFKTNALIEEGLFSMSPLCDVLGQQSLEEMLEVKQLRTDLSEKTRECTTLDQANQQLQANLKEKEREYEELERKLEKITSELRQVEPKIRLVEQMREENRDLREKLSRMERQFYEKRN